MTRSRKEATGSNTNVQFAPASPLSAEFILGVVLVQQFDVCEGKVATFAFTFTLPLAVHVYFSHFHHVAHLERETNCEHQQDKERRIEQEVKSVYWMK